MGNTNLDLRPHQVRALDTLRKTWKSSNRHLLYSPTGSGKTAIAAEIAGGFLDRGMRVLFIAPYTALMDQTANAFMDYGLPQAGFIWRDHEWTDPYKPLQIASADTLIRRSFPDVDVVIVDEVHIRRKRLLEIMRESDVPFIGLTATPFTKWLGNYYDNFIKVSTVRRLIDQGYLSDFEVYAPIRPDLKGVRKTNGAAYGPDYSESDVSEIMGDAKIVGNIVATWLELGENNPTIAFCCNVAHAGHLTNEFNKYGVPAEIMTADTPHAERAQIIKRFEDGVTKIVCNVGVLVAGFDSDVRTIIYARPTQSETRWIQCLGRGLRTAPGKDRCIILDHSGTVHRLGFPDQIEYDELMSDDDGMKEQKQAKREAERKDKLPKECFKCHYMKPAGVFVCPKCGTKPQHGADVEVDESRGLSKIKGEERQTKEDKQKIYSQLLGWQKQRVLQGKKVSDGYIAHLYRSKVGVWPKGLNRNPIEPGVEVLNFIKSRQIAYAKRRR